LKYEIYISSDSLINKDILSKIPYHDKSKEKFQINKKYKSIVEKYLLKTKIKIGIIILDLNQVEGCNQSGGGTFGNI